MSPNTKPPAVFSGTKEQKDLDSTASAPEKEVRAEREAILQALHNILLRENQENKAAHEPLFDEIREKEGNDGDTAENDPVLVPYVSLPPVDYDSLFDYFSAPSLTINEWEFTHTTEDPAVPMAETEQFSNDVMDKIVTTTRMGSLLGVQNYIPIRIKEQHQLLSKLSMVAARLQVKYALWSG